MTYTYKCQCGKVFEVRDRRIEDNVACCTHCGAVAKRIISDTVVGTVTGYSAANGYGDTWEP